MTHIVTGEIGVGKTEFCVNYAINQAHTGRIKLADMDIYNHYYRSRDKAEFLSKNGVDVIGNNLGNKGNMDVPAVSGDVYAAVSAGERLIVDLAGSLAGLKALTFFKARLRRYEFWLVFNAFREKCPVRIASFAEAAEAVSGLRLTGIVHNSHMLRQTAAEHVLYGQKIAADIAGRLNLPIKLTMLNIDLLDELKSQIISPVLTYERLVMREEWA